PKRQDVAPMPGLGRKAGGGAPDDAAIVVRLRDGDETAFVELIDRYGAMMLRVAQMYVRDRASAEEVVQETWLAVLNGIDRFEGRSSLKTWLFRILTNRAKTRGERDARSLPFSALASAEAERDEPAVDPDRFLGPDSTNPGAWAAPPRAWPEDRVLAGETLRVIESAIDMLPEAQRTVIRLRDVEGWSPMEVAEALEITGGNQRVLLHRARSRVRAALEDYLSEEAGR
ncbi:MAG TPA: sigma-70 family RNA polymerase sigma factor, partial [Solirubrobacterales bacterium]|nr:sigma-70 family RNA polymerase sigma factor [Solirubrobacterales bacterium]